MGSGIGLDVVDQGIADRNLFAFRWYDPKTKTQQLKCYTSLWRRYFKDIKSMYIPFKYKEVYHIAYNEELKI